MKKRTYTADALLVAADVAHENGEHTTADILRHVAGVMFEAPRTCGSPSWEVLIHQVKVNTCDRCGSIHTCEPDSPCIVGILPEDFMEWLDDFDAEVLPLVEQWLSYFQFRGKGFGPVELTDNGRVMLQWDAVLKSRSADLMTFVVRSHAGFGACYLSERAVGLFVDWCRQWAAEGDHIEPCPVCCETGAGHTCCPPEDQG